MSVVEEYRRTLVLKEDVLEAFLQRLREGQGRIQAAEGLEYSWSKIKSYIAGNREFLQRVVDAEASTLSEAYFQIFKRAKSNDDEVAIKASSAFITKKQQAELLRMKKREMLFNREQQKRIDFTLIFPKIALLLADLVPRDKQNEAIQRLKQIADEVRAMQQTEDVTPKMLEG